MWEFVWTNKEWLFSGIGVVCLFLVIKVFRKQIPHCLGWLGHVTHLRRRVSKTPGAGSCDHSGDSQDRPPLDKLKAGIRVLFVDDEVFKVVNILKASGWMNISRVKDVKSLDEEKVRHAHIFFIDIQGVGKELGFNDEGLGLALALQEKYPKKKCVIYSAVSSGDRFNKALNRADEILPKNADPYQFQRIVEKLSFELWNEGAV